MRFDNRCGTHLIPEFHPCDVMMKVCGLHLAAHFLLPFAAKCLLDDGADINCRENGLRPALHPVTASGDLPMLRLILDRGANANACLAIDSSSGPFHTTALKIAAMTGDVAVAEVLLEAGADLEEGADLEIFPLGPLPGGRFTALFHAIMSGNAEVTALLTKRGAIFPFPRAPAPPIQASNDV